MTIGERSLELHEKFGGKIEVVSKVPLASREDLSLAYTPGVGDVVKAIAADPASAFKLTCKKNTVAVVSDGSAILGLGNLGALAAIPVMEGKAAIFKAFGGVDAFPICLATQDTEEIIATIVRIAPSFGGINLEDISAPRCFEIEERLRELLDIPVFHDDQHGTAIVVLAALLNALKVVGKNLSETRAVVSGAGAAGTAVVKLLVLAGLRDVVVFDSKGALHAGRTDLNSAKRALTDITNPRGVTGDIGSALKGADIFLGVSQPGVVDESMIASMAKGAIVFAMANPVPEIMPDIAKRAGAAVVATGRSDFPNQVNNAFVFPGFFRGLLDARVRVVTDEMKLAAAMALAGTVSVPGPEKILPDILDPGVAGVIASAVRRMV
jgi:malate dehydrogenase (oxaloacetate-decarboxylating)